MAKGTLAKENLMNKFIEQNKSNFIGLFDKKYYFWSQEDGENVQIAVTLTCPKTPIETDSTISLDGGDLDFSDQGTSLTAVLAAEPAEITQEEQDNINLLFEKLGL